MLCCVSILGYAVYMDNRRLSVDTQSTKPLLEVIARAESKGNYNAHFGNPTNTATKFTDMTIAEVQEWQAKFIGQGAASSAVGRYQIIDSTLAEIVAALHIAPSEKFDESMQDRLALSLLERRGSEKLVNNEMSREEFAANLAMEWASLPKVVGDDPEASYYAGDGLNKSLVSSSDVLQAVDKISPE